MNDRLDNPVLHYGLLLLIYGTGAATLLYHGLGHNAQGTGQTCGQPERSVNIIISDSGLSPNQLGLNRCDQLNINNRGNQPFVTAVGEHNRHQQYPGIDESPILPGGTQKIQMSVSGNYQLHDHNNDELKVKVYIK